MELEAFDICSFMFMISIQLELMALWFHEVHGLR